MRWWNLQITDMSILTKITNYKREAEIPQAMAAVPLDEMIVRAEAAPPALDFTDALQRESGVSLIAEIKQTSPSKGVLTDHFDPLKLAGLYSENGAAAISILTDEPFFQGHLKYLDLVRRNYPRMPLLRKDFVIHPYQVYEARAHGADAILLIAAVLPPGDLRSLLSLSRTLGMAALVETHNREELDAALSARPTIVGINNRNLNDFSVDIETCLSLRGLVPAGTCCVSESGIHTAADMRRMAAARMDAVLVGEALITADDPAGKIKELRDAGKS
jgi:indole-3-glycerol phosphate synthase